MLFFFGIIVDNCRIDVYAAQIFCLLGLRLATKSATTYYLVQGIMFLINCKLSIGKLSKFKRCSNLPQYFYVEQILF